MDFELTPEQRKVEREVYDYLEKLYTPELKAELTVEPEGGSPETAPHFVKCLKKLGEDGWLGIGWPKEYGGQNKTPIEQYIFFDAVAGYYGIPIPMLTLNTVGPTIMREGTEEQKKTYLPRILKGELNVAIGYTEPDAGSDLASLQTTAVKDGDYYIINGTKIFTSLAHFADCIWLAARTDSTVKKHKGISMFMVDINTPGIKVDPMHCMGNFQTNFTYYDNVRVHKDCLIGKENQGWIYINQQLAMERVTLVPHSRPRRAVEEMTKWARENELDGKRVIEHEWVRTALARMEVETEVLKMFNFRVAYQLAKGEFPFAEALMTKIYGSETLQKVNGLALQMMGLRGGLEPGCEFAPGDGRLERDFVAKMLLTFGGGANEVLRDAVALFALGMPRSRQ